MVVIQNFDLHLCADLNTWCILVYLSPFRVQFQSSDRTNTIVDLEDVIRNHRFVFGLWMLYGLQQNDMALVEMR